MICHVPVGQKDLVPKKIPGGGSAEPPGSYLLHEGALPQERTKLEANS